MVTVASVVEKNVAQRPFLQEALSRGIVNNAALAEMLTPEIEKELKKKVKFSAVNMAIRRLAEHLESSFVPKAKFDDDSDLTLKSDLIEINVYKTEDAQHLLKDLYGVVDFRKGDFLTITQGMNEIMIITNKKHEKRIIDLLPKRSVKKVIRRLSSITISIPASSAETAGLFYVVCRALNWENINIVDIVSTLSEMTFIVKEEDVPRAFDALKVLIEENR
jgi:aspartokinase